jgi:hypothetical protein
LEKPSSKKLVAVGTRKATLVSLNLTFFEMGFGTSAAFLICLVFVGQLQG